MPLCIAARTSSVKTSLMRSVTRTRPSLARGVTCTVCAEQTPAVACHPGRAYHRVAETAELTGRLIDNLFELLMVDDGFLARGVNQ